MVRLTPIHAADHFGSLPLAVGLVVTVSAVVALCAKHARRVPRKHETEPTDSKFVPRSPLRFPRHLMTTISNKTIPFIHDRKTEAEEKIGNEKAEEGFGEGGLWQKTILMGEKCQPPEFSGVIYYDCQGNRISEMPPRSPRASPLPSFAFPVTKDAN
ncbi:uncharacterized protein LOC130791253 [Actinidia eriantha]|uniref:uncharacterized protein LOC130791253 n=1 Tax=Actinidia eriantha TaxID=165200 RepID=UPI00258F260D|nr:uncharacterized protein LOC130791253 [Actinidia eriantha]